MSPQIGIGSSHSKVPAGLGKGLIERTQTFRDRVRSSSNGEIEDDSLSGLYDPILRDVKGWGLLPDLVFFASGSAVEVTSGSLPRVFDASGNEQDAIQTTTADQPALDKDSIGGRWGMTFDGSGDELISNNNFATSPTTHFWVASLNTLPADHHIVDGYQSNVNDTRQIIRSFTGNWDIYDSSGLTDDLADQNDHLFEAIFDGANSELVIDGTSVVQGDTGGGTLEDMTIGSNRNDSYWEGPINQGLIFDVRLSSSQRSKIRSRIQDWYSL